MAGVEVYAQHPPLIFGMEYFINQVFSSSTGNPFFHGGEAFVSWLVTGETKPYNDAEGFWEGTIPAKPVFSGGPGAWELAFRASYVDLDSGTVNGGKFWRLTPVLSWYMSDNIRLIAEYGYSRTFDLGFWGSTQYFQTRLQLTFM
jgi:phosphate-selective porin OprO/OprP